MKFSGKISGIPQTKDAFRKITSDFGPALNQMSRLSMAPMLRAAKANAPVDTGALKRSLTLLRVKGSPVNAPVHLIGVRKSSKGYPVRYGSLAEFGRPPNADGKGGYAGARYMTQAFEGQKDEATKIVTEQWPDVVAARIAKLQAKGIRFVK